MNQDSEPADVSFTESVVSDWLDGAFGGADSIVADGTLDKSRAADLLWINALAELAIRSDARGREKRIDLVMREIREDVAAKQSPTGSPASPSPTADLRWSRRAVVWVTTAALLTSAALLMQTANPRRQVHAAIDQIKHATASTEDREYRVTLSFRSPDEGAPEKVERKIEGALFVRGGEAFVVRAPALLRTGDVWFGRDRDGAWFKPVVGPVQAGQGAVLMQQRFLRGSEDSPPFLQLTTVINRLSESYDVRLTGRESLQRKTQSFVPDCQHVVGTLRATASHSPWLPDQVDIHAEPSTGTVLRLRLVWNRETTSLLKQVEFDFVEQSQKPDNWYRPEGRSASQPVQR